MILWLLIAMVALCLLMNIGFGVDAWATGDYSVTPFIVNLFPIILALILLSNLSVLP